MRVGQNSRYLTWSPRWWRSHVSESFCSVSGKAMTRWKCPSTTAAATTTTRQPTAACWTSARSSPGRYRSTTCCGPHRTPWPNASPTTTSRSSCSSCCPPYWSTGYSKWPDASPCKPFNGPYSRSSILIEIVRRLVKIQRRIYIANVTLQYFLTKQWTFLNQRYADLDCDLPKSEEGEFQLIKKVDVNEYFKNCILGARTYLLNESNDTLPKAKVNLYR